MDNTINDLQTRNEELNIFFKENSYQLQRQSERIAKLEEENTSFIIKI